ncbi:MAG: hypothetical protein E7638_07350 [Ruminococcaceae bacterium]|nr:hypothetical protein [Oscillospiraceae bacterium]
MEQENSIALLPPPETAADMETEQKKEPLPEESPPSENLSAEAADEIKPEAVCEQDADSPSPETAAEEKTNGNVLRYITQAVFFALGAFAVLIIAVTVINGIAHLTEEGIGAIVLGELFGGRENISIVSPAEETETTAAEETADLTSLPANEHESAAEETVHQPQSSEPDDGNGGDVGILSADISADGAYGLSLINETPYEVSLSPHSDRAIPPLSELYAEFGEDAPVVLILHTHGTESYAKNGASHTSESEYRSLNSEKNILAVGEALAETLRGMGINVLFCEEMFDAEDFTLAYYNASLKIREYLKEYPSISYIFDLHRDSIPYADGGKTIRPVTEIDGEACAQVMFVVGTDHGGSGHTGWGDNFNLACRVQGRLHSEHQNLMRPINLRSASFNQQYTKGSLLLEMGAVGSSVEEACAAARIIGQAIGEEIIGE